MSDIGITYALALEIDDLMERISGDGQLISDGVFAQSDVTTTFGQFGRRGIQVGDDLSQGLAIDVASPGSGGDALLWWHFRFTVPDAGSNPGDNLASFQSLGTIGESTMRLYYHDDNTGFQLIDYNGTTDSPKFLTSPADGSWWDVFIAKKYSATVGYVKCWINGNLEFDSGNINTGATFPTNQYFKMAGQGSGDKDKVYFMDVVMGDGSTSSSGSFPFNLAVDATLLPNGNGTSSDLTGSDGNSTDNYLNVDEATPDLGTTYNGGATVDDHDGYAMENWTDNTETVRAVIVEAWAAKSDAGAASCRLGVRSNGTDYWGSDEALATTYDYYYIIYGNDPNGGGSWTDARIDGMEVNFAVR